MWFTIVDYNNHKRYINLNYVSSFHFDETKTNIWVQQSSVISVNGDITSLIADMIRRSGDRIACLTKD